MKIRSIMSACKHKIPEFCEATFPLGKKVWLIGTPEHRNLGDSAIVIAEKAFLQQCGIPTSRIKEVTVSEFKQYESLFCRCIGIKDILALHGGGNFGDIWIQEEYFRRHILKLFPENLTVLFPQTAYFSDTPQGRAEKAAAILYYDRKEKMVLTARDRTTFSIMKELFPKTRILLTPDIVLSTNKRAFEVLRESKRSEILCCFRADKERQMSQQEQSSLFSLLEKTKLPVRKTDMVAMERVTKKNRIRLVAEKMKEIAAARLVVTDRLHGMIFAAITKTPCLVFSNNHHKVKEAYEWLQNIPYILYAESITKAAPLVEKLLSFEEDTMEDWDKKSDFSELEDCVRAFWEAK